MVFVIRRDVYRWRHKKNSQKSKKSNFPPSNKDEKLNLQFGSYSLCKITPINSNDCKTVPIFKQKNFITRKKDRENNVRLFGEFVKISKLKNNIGPGSYDIVQWPENFLNKTGSSVKKNLDFGTTSRFLKKVKFSTPGPGYVGINHNPYYFIENKKKQGVSKLPTFEFDGLAPRIPKIKSTSLAPNRYKIKYPNSLDSFIEKKTGKRGPYDLFTGPRDYSTVKGYFIAPVIFENSDWPKKLPGEIEKLFHKSNHFKGVFGKNPRFPKSGPIGPGPNHYELENQKQTRIVKNNNCAFGKSLEKEKKLGCREICPCPGQYNLEMKKIIHGSGWKSIFKSKLPRIKSLVKESYNSF